MTRPFFSVETLVPANFITTHSDCATDAGRPSDSPSANSASTMFWFNSKEYYNLDRVRRGLGDSPPRPASAAKNIFRLDDYRWKPGCRGLYQLPAAAWILIRPRQVVHPSVIERNSFSHDNINHHNYRVVSD
jgi:hypothetical protein